MKKNMILIVLLLFVLVACNSGVDPEVIATQAADVVSDVRDTVEGEGETDQPAPTTGSADQPPSDLPSDRWAGNTHTSDMSAISDVTISINGAATQSDGNGNFELSVPRADNSRYVVNAEKDGYLPLSLIHIGSAMDALILEFQPVETIRVNPAEGVATEDSSGTQIGIAPHQLVDENGNEPSGEVNLNMYTYDLENEEMVGDMSGTNSDGEPVYMESEGAFYASFEDDAGTEYNLAEGATAEISIPCEPRPDETLTVWSYDPNTGLWIEEGPVVIEDDRCSAEVSHFSYWNFDYEKRTPSCIKLEVAQSYLTANTPLNVRAVLQTNPTRVIDLMVSEQVNVLINLPNNTDVKFYKAPDYTNAFATTNSGPAWGDIGTPAYPYDACKGVAEIAAAPAPSTLQGQVVDATTGQPIAGAQVCVLNTSLCANTDSAGNYTLTGVPTGQNGLKVIKDGYIPVENQPFTVEPGQTATENSALSPVLPEGEIRIVLTWGEAPTDLDAHLWVPVTGSSPYHIYYVAGSRGSLDNAPFAQLDLDNVDGEVPATNNRTETITISQQQNGTYTYAVDRYSTDGTIPTSGAVVTVYKGNQVINTFTAPTTGDSKWWHVFNLDGATGAITPVNTLSDTQPIQ